ncbi:MAG: ECF transporter S component [Ruminococcaceae bacterium]|nr:ECF transporter S component [Oscillospiraceae bacterium]
MKANTRMIAGLGLFTAIVVVLQLTGAAIKFGVFSITMTLAPIIIGAALYGIGAGAWLGLAFGIAVLISGDAGAFLAVNPVGTVITVLLKGALAGVAAAAVYKAIESKNKFAAVLTAGITAPVVNTGVFLLGCLAFFMPTINEWAAAAGVESAGKFIITGMVGINFLVELAVNLVLSTVIVRIINLLQKQQKRNEQK